MLRVKGASRPSKGLLFWVYIHLHPDTPTPLPRSPSSLVQQSQHGGHFRSINQNAWRHATVYNLMWLCFLSLSLQQRRQQQRHGRKNMEGRKGCKDEGEKILDRKKLMTFKWWLPRDRQKHVCMCKYVYECEMMQKVCVLLVNLWS